MRIRKLSPLTSLPANWNDLDTENKISSPVENIDSARKRAKLESSGWTSYDRNRLDLNDDLLIKVLSFLDNHIDYCYAAEVCRQWREIIAHNDLLRCLSFKNSMMTKVQFYKVFRRYPNIVKLNINGGNLLERHVMVALRHFRNLETLVLSLGGEAIRFPFFSALEGCLALRSLSIMDGDIGVSGFNQQINIVNSGLHVLNLIRCRVHILALGCPQLKVLSVRHCNITIFKFRTPDPPSYPPSFSNRPSFCKSICTSDIFSPLLTSLQIEGSSGPVIQEMLSAISKRCAHLRVLDASNFPQLSLESIVFPELSVLKLKSCEVIDTTLVPWICKSSMLEVLEICNCCNLDSLSLNLRYLKTIKLDHCDKVADLSLEGHMLSYVTISSCVSLQSINLTSNSLTKLVLQGLDNLSTLALDCPVLQEVHLTENKSSMNFVCNVFSDGGGCPALASLVLDCSKSLTTLKLRNTSLVSISLFGCCGMIYLELTCPYLKQLFLEGCDSLETAVLRPVGFESLNLGTCPKLSTFEIEACQLEVLELNGYGSLSKISVNCPRLMLLDTSFCSRLKDVCLDAITTTCLKSIIFTSCSQVTLDGLSSWLCLTRLTLLDLSYTYVTSLEPVFESCLQLEILKLQACKYLTDYSLQPIYRDGALPALCNLDLSNGYQSWFVMKELLVCTRLTHLNLSGCVNMHDLDSLEDVLQPIEQRDHLLQRLDCVGCPNIKKVFISAAVQWVHLSSLNLSLSVNLKEVDLACSNMRYLNLSNCSSLKILKLDCPKLNSLYLQSCNVTEETIQVVVSRCGELKTLDVRDCPRIFLVTIGRLRAACPSLQRIFSTSSNL